MITYACIFCNKDCKFGYSKLNKYCSNICQREHQRHINYERLILGELKQRATIKQLLIWKNGWHCSNCNLSEWLGHPIPLELDHSNGDAGDNRLINVTVICANCHSLTPTWKGRNKGNGRKSRGLPLC